MRRISLHHDVMQLMADKKIDALLVEKMEEWLASSLKETIRANQGGFCLREEGE